jgi:hypothetical protein
MEPLTNWKGANLPVAGLDGLFNYILLDTSIHATDGVPTVPKLSQSFETLVISEMTFLGPNLGALKEFFCRPHKPPERLASTNPGRLPGTRLVPPIRP